jgi:hypothetical protein
MTPISEAASVGGLFHFPFALSAGTKTTLSAETNSGLSRIASVTLNEGSGFHFVASLTSDSVAAVIA